MPDFYFILFIKRLDADEKLQYFQLPYIPCRMVWNKVMLKIFLFTNLFYTLWNFINLYITQAEPQAIGCSITVNSACD
jgi:hypothetical protein